MHAHAHSIPDSLKAAEAACAREGESFTPLRKRVYTLLLSAEGPAKAYDLLAQIGEPGRPAKPPTVYRALEFLVRLGLAHRIESLNAFVACDISHPHHAAAFLICDTCGTAQEVESASVAAALTRAAEAGGFRLASAVVEARGICGDCSHAA